MMRVFLLVTSLLTLTQATVNVVEGDILVEVDHGEAGAQGMLHTVVITDTDRSTLNINTPREV